MGERARGDYLRGNVSLPWPGAAIYTRSGRAYMCGGRRLLSWARLTQSVFGRVFAFAHI